MKCVFIAFAGVLATAHATSSNALEPKDGSPRAVAAAREAPWRQWHHEIPDVVLSRLER